MGNRTIDSLYQGRVGARNQGEKTQQVGILGGEFLTLFTMPISLLRIKCVSSWD